MNESPTPPASPAPQPNQGLSTASLILGIVSVVGCTGFTGIPAIITGHIARRRARREPQHYSGAGMALAGLILGYVGTLMTIVVLAIVAAVALPALAKAKQQAQTVACVNNLKQIGLAARIWSNDHREVLPPDFLSMSNELNSPRILVCPGDGGRTVANTWSEFDPAQNASYDFLLPNAKEADVFNQPVFHCPIHGNVALGDGSVQSNLRRR